MFELIDYVVKINPSSLNIPEFKEIWKRDKKRNKADAHAELSYVYYMSDFQSEYRNYPYDEREDKVKEDFCKKALGEDWKPDMKVLYAIEKYEKMQITPSLRFLGFVETEIDKMRDFLNSLEMSEDNIKLKIDSMDKITKYITQLPKLKESVKKEVSESTKIRGGGDVGLYED